MMDKLEELTLGFSWQCWTALGVRGTPPPVEHVLIDPEGLLIFTSLVDTDARLAEEVIDWCAKYPDYVSVTRLRNLSAELSDHDRTRLHAFTARVNAVSSAKWPDDGRKAKPTRLSGKSRLSSLSGPALAHLRYRAIFGTTARAEILLCLGRTSSWLSTSDVARATGHKKRIIARTLDELSLGGLVNTETRGNRLDHRLADKKRLEAFAGPVAAEDFAWVSWARVLSACQRVAGKKETVQRIEIARVLEEAKLREVEEPTRESIRTALEQATLKWRLL